jgi:tRNA threonylcarbamoyladenosine biosynthesis protein TsaE
MRGEIDSEVSSESSGEADASGAEFAFREVFCGENLGCGCEMICKTADETRNFAKKIAGVLRIDASIALVGDLGSGKTTFVQGLAAGLGIGANVGSPSFNILSVYAGRPVTLLHVDAYRLDGGQRAANDLMIDDFLISPYCLVVEWPELLHNFLNVCDFEISFTILGDISRKIAVRRGSKGRAADGEMRGWGPGGQVRQNLTTIAEKK